MLRAARSIDSTLRYEGDYDDALAKQIAESHMSVRQIQDEITTASPALAIAYDRAGTPRILHDLYKSFAEYTDLMRYIHDPPAEDDEGAFYEPWFHGIAREQLIYQAPELGSSFLDQVSIEKETQLQAVLDAVSVLAFGNGEAAPIAEELYAPKSSVESHQSDDSTNREEPTNLDETGTNVAQETRNSSTNDLLILNFHKYPHMREWPASELAKMLGVHDSTIRKCPAWAENRARIRGAKNDYARRFREQD